MPIIGLNFDSVFAEKKKELRPPIKINTNLEITEVKKEEASIGSKDESVLRFNFEFSLIYDPKVADLVLKGHIHYLDNAKNNDKVLAAWKKDKKYDTELSRQLINAALLKCSIKALLISQEVGLPPHIRLPMLSKA